MLVVNIGSVCERKGQHIYIQAVDLLAPNWPALSRKKIRFLMVGARPGLFLETLKEEIARLGVGDLMRFAPETGEVFDYYQVADIFVCTSFEESFPRVLLESAAFRRLIVSTNVNGIAEMIGPDEAWLMPPGDRYRLAEGLKSALAAHFAGDRTRPEKPAPPCCANTTRRARCPSTRNWPAPPPRAGFERCTNRPSASTYRMAARRRGLAGPVAWLRGWIVGKSGHDFTDVRVRHGGGTHLGVLGLPRTGSRYSLRRRAFLVAGGIHSWRPRPVPAPPSWSSRPWMPTAACITFVTSR